LVLAFSAAAANAQATRTWVSGVGDDANPCSRTAPCKTFAGAISKTAAGGEISVLDPGGFGVVTITKAITINGDGTLAGILAAGSNGIIVNAGVNDEVIIKNVSINGATTGLNGVRYLAGKQLTLKNVTINGFTTRGIDMSLTATGALFVEDVHITDVPTGIRVATTAGNAVFMADNVRIEKLSADAIELATGSVFASLHNVWMSQNNNGVNLTGATAQADLDSCTMSFNQNAGVRLGIAGARARLSGNAFLNNSNGVQIVGGVANTTADNVFAGNSINGAVTNDAAQAIKQ
jgi:hypothetical protein